MLNGLLAHLEDCAFWSWCWLINFQTISSNRIANKSKVFPTWLTRPSEKGSFVCESSHYYSFTFVGRSVVANVQNRFKASIVSMLRCATVYILACFFVFGRLFSGGGVVDCYHGIRICTRVRCCEPKKMP